MVWTERSLVLVARPSAKSPHPGIILATLPNGMIVVATGTSKPITSMDDHVEVQPGTKEFASLGALTRCTYFYVEFVELVRPSELSPMKGARRATPKLYAELRKMARPSLIQAGAVTVALHEQQAASVVVQD